MKTGNLGIMWSFALVVPVIISTICISKIKDEGLGTIHDVFLGLSSILEVVIFLMVLRSITYVPVYSAVFFAIMLGSSVFLYFGRASMECDGYFQEQMGYIYHMMIYLVALALKYLL